MILWRISYLKKSSTDSPLRCTSRSSIRDLHNKFNSFKLKPIISRTAKLTKNFQSFLKATVIEQDTYKSCIQIKIWFIRCHKEPPRTVLQCFKCQNVVHTHFNCKNETVFLECRGNHLLKECLIENQVKCINCGGNHFTPLRNSTKKFSNTRFNQPKDWRVNHKKIEPNCWKPTASSNRIYSMWTAI